MDLTPVEVRVLGCLVEKQRTTPQYYPLTLNALVTACNQTSNRHPVVAYQPDEVQDALASLRERELTRIVYSVHNRATKYRHVLDEALRVSDEELALLAILMLRGAQTVGELRGRSERMAEFASLDQVEATLDALAAREAPLVARLPRQPGQKEVRYAHLLAGPPSVDDEPAPAVTAAPSARGAAAADGAALEAVARLEDEVRGLREELDDLRREVAELRQVFE